MWRNTSNGMRVRDVWFNGKRWTDHTPASGPNVGQHFTAVRANAGQRWPRTFGPTRNRTA